MLQELMQMFRSLDPIPFIMLALVCVGWVIVLERFFSLQLIYRVNFNKFNTNMRKMLASGDLERARAFCASTSKAGVPLIAVKAIDAFQTDSFKVRNVVSEEILSFVPRVRRRLSQIPNLATVTILVGALATVQAIWSTFRTADAVDFSVKGATITHGLGAAFVPLSFAILGCATLLLPYGMLDAIASRLEGEVEHSLTIILNILAPETATVISHSGMPMADTGGGGHQVADVPVEVDAPVEAEEENKGSYEDALAGENAPVLDEEEII